MKTKLFSIVNPEGIFLRNFAAQKSHLLIKIAAQVDLTALYVF